MEDIITLILWAISMFMTFICISLGLEFFSICFNLVALYIAIWRLL